MDEEYNHRYAKAIRYLARRPRSTKEMQDYLTKMHVKQTDASAIISSLLEKNFLDDEGFTKWWIDQRSRFKQKGEKLIKFELQQKGIPEEIIQKVYAEKENHIVSDREKARVLIAKYSRYNLLDKQERYKKFSSLFSRKGFDFSTIQEVLKKSGEDIS